MAPPVEFFLDQISLLTSAIDTLYFCLLFMEKRLG